MSSSRPLLWLAGIGTLVIAGAVMAMVAKRRKRAAMPSHWKEVGEVASLYVYPAKSLKGVPVEEATCTLMGLTHGHMRDRVYLVVDQKNNFITQRQEPKMALIRTSCEEDTLCLDAPDMPTIRVNIPEKAKRVTCRIWSDHVNKVIDCGDEVAMWLSNYLAGQPEGRRLLYYPRNDSPRQLTEKDALMPQYTQNDTGVFTDKSSYLLIAKESVADLNTRLQTPVSHHNFRPNILIRGAKPYAEDDWKWIKIGDIVFEVSLPCGRCLLTTVNQDTGIKDANSEPLATLRSYREPTDPLVKKIGGKAPLMGLYMGLRSTGKDAVIHVGDKVLVGYDNE